jgi:hypothetical protein
VLVPELAQLDDIALATLDHLARDGAGGRNLPQRTSNRIAALFLDHAPSHIRDAMIALRFSKHETNWATAIAERWAEVALPLEAALESGTPSDADVRRWLAAIGRLHVGGFLRVAGARWQAMRDAGRAAPPAATVRSLHKRMARGRFSDALEVGDLAIGGDELRKAGIPAGPIYAKILHALLERVLESPATNTSELLLAELPGIVAALGKADPSRRSG